MTVIPGSHEIEKKPISNLIGYCNTGTQAHITIKVGGKIKVFGYNIPEPKHVFFICIGHKIEPQPF